MKTIAGWLLAVVGGWCAPTWGADPLASWTSQSSGTTNRLTAVAYAGGQFVAVGAGGTVITSADGLTWAQQSPGTTNTLTGVAFGGGQFVAVGEAGAVITSTNGSVWAQRATGTTNDLRGITYGNGQFLAVGVGVLGSMLTSPDGIHWTPGSFLTFYNQLRGAAYGNGQFVVVGDSEMILRSADAASWTLAGFGGSETLSGVTYGNGRFVAVGGDPQFGEFLSSGDGVNWALPPLPVATNDHGLHAVAFGANQFVAGGDAGTIFSSGDGSYWTWRGSGISNALNGLTYGNGRFVAVGESGSVVVSGTLTPAGSVEPRIVAEPVNQVVLLGGMARFVPVVQGDLPLTFTWFKEGIPVPGGTNQALVIGAVTTNDVGSYWFVVSNAFGSVTSLPASLTLRQRDGLDEWTVRSPWPTGAALGGVAFGNGRFVAIGSGIAVLSPDGAAWTPQGLGMNSGFSGVGFVNGRFAAVGSSGTPNGFQGTIGFSTNGITWTQYPASVAFPLTAIAHNGTQYVAVGQSGTIVASTDGVSWSQRAIGMTNTLTGVVYGNGEFVAVGEGGAVFTSPDGDAWSRQSAGTTLALRGIALGNGLFVAVGAGGLILTSPDGVNWARTGPPGYSFSCIGYGGGLFMAVAAYSTGNFVFTSPDGTNWTKRASITGNTVSAVASGNGQWVAVGANGAVASSADGGLSWLGRSSGTTQDLEAVVSGKDGFVAVGWNNTIVSEVDGGVWVVRNSGGSDYLRSIVYGNGQYVAATPNTILTSTNGSNWMTRAPAFSGSLADLICGSNLFVGVGSIYLGANRWSGSTYTSKDAITWTSRTVATSNGFDAVVYGNSTYVAVGERGVIFASTDARTWTARNSGTTNRLTAVAYGNGQFVAAGSWLGPGSSGTPILTSGDTWTWTARTIPGPSYVNGIAFGGGQFVTFSYDGLWTSPDGIGWTERELPALPGRPSLWLSAVAFGGDRFVAVGAQGAILESGSLQRAPVLDSIRLLPDGTAQIGVAGVIGQSCRLDAASNLVDWLPLINVTLTNGNASVTDADAVNLSRRFYRAVAP